MPLQLNEITREIVRGSILVHQTLGPGLLESAYESILAGELVRRGFSIERQKSVDLNFNDIFVPNAYSIDLLVESQVVVELKSVERIAPVHKKQVLTYLRLMNLHVGLLINFGGVTLMEGLVRIVNGPPP